MRPFGILDSGGEVALAVGLLVLFAVLGFAWVMGWLDQKPDTRVTLTDPKYGGWLIIEDGPTADKLREQGWVDVEKPEHLR